MNFFKKSLAGAALSVAVVAAVATPAQAEWKPNKPITIIVPWSAGGSTDQVTRVVAPILEKALGTKIAVVNQSGASGSIGTAAALPAPRLDDSLGRRLYAPLTGVGVLRRLIGLDRRLAVRPGVSGRRHGIGGLCVQPLVHGPGPRLVVRDADTAVATLGLRGGLHLPGAGNLTGLAAELPVGYLLAAPLDHGAKVGIVRVPRIGARALGAPQGSDQRDRGRQRRHPPDSAPGMLMRPGRTGRSRPTDDGVSCQGRPTTAQPGPLSGSLC